MVGVNWRSTKIGDRFNNLIMIPNSTMMDSIMTNYYAESNRTVDVMSTWAGRRG